MRTSVAITTLDRLPSQRDRVITCKLCGWSCPRWQKRLHDDDSRRSGVLLMISHQLSVHGGEEE